jgi:hypothetical protein
MADGKFQFGKAHQQQAKANEKAEQAANASKDSTGGKVGDSAGSDSAVDAAGSLSAELAAGQTGTGQTNTGNAILSPEEAANRHGLKATTARHTTQVVGGKDTITPDITTEGVTEAGGGPPPLANPKLDSHTDFFSQSTTAVVKPSPEGIAKASGGTTKVVNRIESAVPFVGQERNEGEHRFQVQLEGEPAEEVFAKDRLEAQQRYSARLGIVSTIKPYRISQVD